MESVAISLTLFSDSFSRAAFATLKKNAAGTWVGAATIPRWTTDGSWQIFSLNLSDKAGNGRSYTKQQLSDAGFPTAFTVTSTPDTTPPKLKSFTFSPGSVNTARGTKTVTVTAKAVDSQSGVSGVFASAQSTTASPTGSGAFLSKVKGTATTYRGKMTIPMWVRTSTWHMTSVGLSDKIGNFTSLSYAQLGARASSGTSASSADPTPQSPSWRASLAVPEVWTSARRARASASRCGLATASPALRSSR